MKNRYKNPEDYLNEDAKNDTNHSEKEKVKSRPKMKSHTEKGVVSVGKAFATVLGGSILTHKKFIKNIPFMILLFFMAVIYIYNNYWAEKTLIKLERSKRELIEFRHEFISSKSDMMDSLRESNILMKLQPLGITENNKPPYKLLLITDSITNGKGE